MNINNNGKTLYFSDDEIENETNGEKKVFVTKRINGKETHTKIEKNKTNQDAFNFNHEIVLGVNNKENKNQSKNNVIRKEKNKKSYKKNHKKIKNKKLITFIWCLFFLVLLIVFALKAPIFNIIDIQVEGNEKISKDEIINLSGLKLGENIFKFNNKIIMKIKENRYIDNVKISRNLPGTVIVQVQERKVRYKINLINSYTYIDSNGYILENSTINLNVPIIIGFSITENEQMNSERLNIEDLKKLNKIDKIIESVKTINKENEISEITIENEESFILKMDNERKKIYIGDSTNLNNKVLFLKSILDKEKDNSGIIFLNGDFNNGFKPYFREE